MSYDIDLAKKLKERNNSIPIGNIVGKVVSAFPDIKISILDGNVILTKDKLYCCNSVLANYARQATITGNIQLSCATQDGGSPSHSHGVNVNTNSSQICTVTYTDSLVIGDFVLLSHTANEQIWFIIDKITKL